MQERAGPVSAAGKSPPGLRRRRQRRHRGRHNECVAWSLYECSVVHVAGTHAEAHFDAGYKDGKLKLEFSAEVDDIVFLVPEFNPYEQAADGAGHCKIMAVRVANPESSFGTGGPLGAVMGGIGSVLGGGKGRIGGMLGGLL